MNPTLYAIIGGIIMITVLTLGTIQAWRLWRQNPADALRSVRLKHLSTAIFGIWLLLAAALVTLVGKRPGPHGIGGLAFPITLALPLASAAAWALGHYAQTVEQREARTTDEALGLVVPPRRRSPTTLALWYTLGLFTVVPILILSTLFGTIYVGGIRVLDDQMAQTGFTMVVIVEAAYLAFAGIHITTRWWRIRREALEARRANLNPATPGASEPLSPAP